VAQLFRPTTNVDAPVDSRVRRIGREHAEAFARYRRPNWVLNLVPRPATPGPGR